MSDVFECDLKFGLEWASAAFALSAVLFWLASAWSGFDAFKPKPINVENPMIRIQARRNAIAAASAGVSAACQLITLWLPVCRAFG